MHKTIEDIVRLFEGCSKVKDLRITYKNPTQDIQKEFISDNMRIKQVLCTLVNNSVKFSQGGGSITIWSERKENDKQVIVYVSDQGKGMSTNE